MIRVSGNGQGHLIICDRCKASTETPIRDWLEVVKKIARTGGQVRQEVRRTGSGYGTPFWRNYCSKCTQIEGILLQGD